MRFSVTSNNGMLQTCLVCFLALFQFFGIPVVAGSELPSESSLPGQKRKLKTLPTERELPAKRAVSTFAGEPRSKASQLLTEVPPESALPASNATLESPSDTELPALDPADAVAAPVAEPAPPALRRPAGQPWLRLNMGGHTAPIRALVFSQDGSRLCSAGEDKTVEIWSQPAILEQPRWVHERTIRWQVHRGPRGRIYALAEGHGLLAIAGHGAMNSLGEIWLVDPATGQLNRPLLELNEGHRQPVIGLSFSPDKQRPALASIDMDGQIMVWQPDAQTGVWRGFTICQPDGGTYGVDIAKQLQRWRRIAPILWLDQRTVVAPVFVGHEADPTRPDPQAKWQLERFDVDTGARTRIPGKLRHADMITAMAASRDGRQIASADVHRQLFVWNLTESGGVSQVSTTSVAISLAFEATGQKLLVGTSKSETGAGQASVQLWNLRDPNRPVKTAEVPAAYDVYACQFHPHGRTLAYTQGNAVIVRSAVSIQDRPTQLSAPIGSVLNVAFSQKPPLYNIGFSTRKTADRSLEQSFDTYATQLQGVHPQDKKSWLFGDTWRANWSIQTARNAAGQQEYWLNQAGARRSRLPLTPQFHGSPTAECWLPDRTGKPWALAVATSLTNNIYVFRLAQSGDAPIVRQFRGHEGAINSISVSLDQRYLVSGANDATVRVWKLSNSDKDGVLLNRWGAVFEVQGDELKVSTIREDGPLFFRGLRTGDTVARISWHDGRERQTAETPNQILKVLNDEDWSIPIALFAKRARLDLEGFALLPAWQPVVSFFVADNREWAYWTPAGYYDASFDGHKLFGWQFNQGLNALPDFFAAAQLRQEFERPAVMQRLLETGSLEEAFRLAGRAPPVEMHRMLVDAYRQKPQIEITSPQANADVTSSVTVRAAISLRNGLRLARAKAYANGVVASEPRIVETRTVPGGQQFVYEWKATLPSDRRIRIDVIAATDTEVAEHAQVLVNHTPAAGQRRHRMLFVGAGVNQYLDPQIPQLDFATKNVETVLRSLESHSGSLYRTESVQLLDANASSTLWRVATQEYADRLREQVSADDLLIVFLSGHGMRDEMDDKYYFVGSNARFRDVKSGRFQDCLSFADFNIFASLPCRKLVILDTCHSGSVQPLRQQELKAAVRALQDDVVLTLTASEGSQEAAEDRDRGLGRFTARLVEAIQGNADQPAQGGNGDGLVSLVEAANYVKRTVADDASGSAIRQFPTASPADLLEFVELPLTSHK